MPRPVRLEEQRRELLPILASAFGELGYRRATTAELARRCGVKENILYRHWQDKSAMFVAALDYVHDLAEGTWRRALESGTAAKSPATQLIDYEAEHLGEFGNYRIIFSALGDRDDPAIEASLQRMYRGFHSMLRKAIGEERKGRSRSPEPGLSAWAVIGIGTIATIGQELGVISKRQRKQLIGEVGKLLSEGRPAR